MAAPIQRRTTGEEARTLVHGTTLATLATLAVDPPGHPFGSLVTYGVLDDDGTPVLFLSTLAEHTRNLMADPRASLLVAAAPSDGGGDALADGRVTLLGEAERLAADDARKDAAQQAYLAANPGAAGYLGLGDFSFWLLQVRSLRWVGGFGRMAWCDVAEYAAARPDPTAAIAASAVEHLNDDHADALLAAARAFTGHADATAARATGVDRYGVDLDIDTPAGRVSGRAPFDPPVENAAGLRAAAVALTRAAREMLAVPSP
jgi:putative heme iron utilization protein